MGFDGVTTSKTSGGLGRVAPSKDGVVALVAGGVAVATKLVLGDIYKLTQISDAEALGVDASYDDANTVLLYQQLSEIFHVSPNATIYLMVVAQGTTQTQIWDVANDYMKKLILSDVVNREAKILGSLLNPLTDYTATVVGGVDDDVLTAIPKAQALIDSMKADGINIQSAFVEGRSLDAVLANIPDFRALASRNVAVVGGQDPTIAALHAIHTGYASVGTALGGISVRKVSENLGSVDIEVKPVQFRGTPNYTLTDGANLRWMSSALSSGKNVSNLSGKDKNDLTAKGLIYVGSYEGYPGLYFNSSPTCVAIDDDYAYVENNRIWGKAADILQYTMTPRIKGKIKRDPNTGNIKNTTIKRWEQECKEALNVMVGDSDVGGVGIVIDPSQVISEASPFKIGVALVIDDILYELDFALGLTTKI